jgi:hypothetical protein
LLDEQAGNNGYSSNKDIVPAHEPAWLLKGCYAYIPEPLKDANYL